MKLFISGATATIRRCAADTDKQHLLLYLGHLLNPRSYNSMEYLFATGLPVAADNDCFQGLNRAQYVRMLRRLKGKSVLWVTAPDVVADAAQTLTRWRIWYPVLRYYGLPTAYVAQDGSEVLAPPWDELDCLFIGGSTEWKLGPYAADLIREAHKCGKWVHVGRVNTLKRMWLLSSLPVDSIDGTCFSRFPDKYIPWMARRLTSIQHRMEDILCVT